LRSGLGRALPGWRRTAVAAVFAGMVGGAWADDAAPCPAPTGSDGPTPRPVGGLWFAPLPFDGAASNAVAPEQVVLDIVQCPPAETSSFPGFSEWSAFALSEPRADPLVFPPLPFADMPQTPAAAASNAPVGGTAEMWTSAPADGSPSPGILAPPTPDAGTGTPPSAILDIAQPREEPSGLAALAAAIAELPPPESGGSAAQTGGGTATAARVRPSRPAESVAPPSGVETEGETVRVSVFIDVPFEGVRHPEGTAMLRTKAWLRKTFPALPRDFSLPGRIVVNGFDDDERVYRYCSEYRREDVDRLISANSPADDAPGEAERPESAPAQTSDSGTRAGTPPEASGTP